MISAANFLAASAVLAVANAHGVILGAQGAAGSPASVGFLGKNIFSKTQTIV
jgi:hypothetical protein